MKANPVQMRFEIADVFFCGKYFFLSLSAAYFYKTCVALCSISTLVSALFVTSADYHTFTFSQPKNQKMRLCADMRNPHLRSSRQNIYTQAEYIGYYLLKLLPSNDDL